MNELERQVLKLIGEDTANPDVFTDDDEGLAPIRDWLNDAIEELCMVTGHYRRRYLLALMEERCIYRLAPQNDLIGWVTGVWDRANHQPLQQSDIGAVANRDPYWIKRNGNPQYYWQMGWDHFGVYPRPGSKGTILELECLCIPKAYTYPSQPIPLREQWRQGTVFRAVSEFFASRGDAKRAQEWFMKFLEVTGLMVLHPQQFERQYQMTGGQQNQQGKDTR